MLYKTKGSKKSGRTFTNHDNRLAIAHIWIFCHSICKVGRFLIYVCTHGEINIDLTLTSVYATTNYTNSLNGTYINALLFRDMIDDKR